MLMRCLLATVISVQNLNLKFDTIFQKSQMLFQELQG